VRLQATTQLTLGGLTELRTVRIIDAAGAGIHSAVDEADDCTGIMINGGSDTASFVELASKVSTAPFGCRMLHVGAMVCCLCIG
jgi:hypothetical protein